MVRRLALAVAALSIVAAAAHSASLFDPDRSVASRDVPGGPGRDSVRAQIAALATS